MRKAVGPPLVWTLYPSARLAQKREEVEEVEEDMEVLEKKQRMQWLPLYSCRRERGDARRRTSLASSEKHNHHRPYSEALRLGCACGRSVATSPSSSQVAYCMFMSV